MAKTPETISDNLPATVTETFLALRGGEEALEAMRENIGEGNLSLSDFDVIKVPSGGGIAWEITKPDGSVDAVTSIEGIILHHKQVRALFPGKDPQPGVPPVCRSEDAKHGTGTPGGDCLTCPMAEFGSKGHGQLCKLMMQVALLVPGARLPKIIMVPPTSIPALRKSFLRMLDMDPPTAYYNALMELRLEKSTSKDNITYSKISARIVRRLGADEMKAIAGYREALIQGILGRVNAAVPRQAED